MKDEVDPMRRQEQAVTMSSGRSTLPAPLVEQLLNSMDVRIEAFAVCRVGANAALAIPAVNELKIIYVLTGTVYLSVEGCEQQELPPGSIVLIPKNRTQVQAGGKAPEHRFDVKGALHKGPHDLMYLDAFDGTHEIQVLCGWLRLGLTAEFNAFDGLLNPISANLNSSAFVRSAFETMIDETRFRTAGSRTLANTLMKACMVELFRHGLARAEPDRGSPAIFLKPGLSRAVTAILSQPAAPHSVASLAKIASMSRSAFAKAFEETMGTTPIEFVGRARLAKARDLVLATDDPIASIAESVGFASRSHFSSRFRERYGEDPSAYRKRMTAVSATERFASVTSICARTDESPLKVNANEGTPDEANEGLGRKTVRSGGST
ncbi:helix-turn-helix domain-containing protein [Luteimonas sp. R10]|uniref:helix-turn-helix domain-containing protein n=1 Tax=Luteimonas sp. R10 TaxID=3108176 RepID=UPI00308DFE14|nr:helix-turn-helix domain-containing protein [Luteimonas sp. R10]